MEEITSLNNQLVKDTLKLQQKKYRDKENLFLLEGYKAIYEAHQANIDIKYIFVLKKHYDKYSFYNGRTILTTEEVLNKISLAASAPDVVGVAVQKAYSKEEFVNANKLILLENISDLGNLGTIIRTAAAFDIDGIVLYGDCADLYNPKCVRSTVGNLWKIPVLQVAKFADLEKMFKNFHRIATLPKATNFLKGYRAEGKTLIMFGSEADGLSKDLIDFSTRTLKIEMSDKVESLNLAISCAIVMYEAFVG